jgi:hypothetical protein
LSDHLVRWLSFLKGVDKSKWEELSMDKPELKKAMKALEYLSQDQESRMLYEMRMKALTGFAEEFPRPLRRWDEFRIRLTHCRIPIKI